MNSKVFMLFCLNTPEWYVCGMKQFFPDFSILHKLLSAFTQIGFKLALFQNFVTGTLM